MASGVARPGSGRRAGDAERQHGAIPCPLHRRLTAIKLSVRLSFPLDLYHRMLPHTRMA